MTVLTFFPNYESGVFKKEIQANLGPGRQGKAILRSKKSFFTHIFQQKGPDYFITLSTKSLTPETICFIALVCGQH
jgi:hypothetical protein